MHDNTASSKRYRENENYRKTKLKAVAKKYETNDSFRSKRKASSKESYASSPTKKARKKDAIKNQRIAKRARLDNQEEVVRIFKQKAKQGIDYSCCCCDRLLFQNQVQKCERLNYAKNQQATNVANLCI